MLEIYSTVHRHITNKFTSQNSTIQTTQSKPFPLNAFVIRTNFKPVESSKRPKPLRIVPYKKFNISPMLRMNIWPKMALHFTLIAITFCHLIPKNLVFSHISVHIQLPPILTTRIQTPIKILLLKSPQLEFDTPFEPFNLLTSIKTIAQANSNLESLLIYQNLPSSTPLIDNLDDTFNSTDSDFEMLQNSIYHSTSLLQFYARVVDSPNLSFETSQDSQTFPTHI